MNVRDILMFILIAVTAVYAIYFVMDVLKNGKEQSNKIWLPAIIVGLVTDFFDTLGIGSFAPTTAAIKFGKLSDDRLIPGTLNVSHTIPVVVEAYIFIDKVSVETVTLIGLIGAAVIGSYIGAGFISKLDRKMVQKIMGVALIAVAAIMLVKQLGLISALATSDEQLNVIKEKFTDQQTLGADNTITHDGVVYMLADDDGTIIPAGIGLAGFKLIISIAIFFVLGALMTAGVGLYAPAMAVVYMIGLSPIVAFPIMMGSCAFLMPVAGFRFIKEKAYDRKLSLGITIGGVVGVLIAANLVIGMPMEVLTYIVIAVVTVVGVMMLMEGIAKKSELVDLIEKN